jgi:Fic family protein
LITLLLCEGGLLDEPLLYLSLYLKQNRKLYYDLLQEVRVHGVWETWIEFFLDGVLKTAKQAVQTAIDINTLFEHDLMKIASLGRARLSCERALEHLKMLPQVTVSSLANALGMSPPTARSALVHMMECGILEEVTGQKRDKIYVYRTYLILLEEGAEPIRSPS